MFSMLDIICSVIFEEVVLLFIDLVFYFCWFDWNFDKVFSFERVDLVYVIKIRFGIYIMSIILFV